ncbi:MAG: hypothetical protein NVSMB25_14810 [Thermoleophilaceae bacterium]
MAPANAADPDPKHGAYMIYSVDAGPEQTIRGGSGSIAVTTDGQHTVTYQAFDLAGNGTGQRSVNFKIDQTAPVAGFEAQDPGDPTKVSVIASDATSGLADGGLIRMRNGSSGGWTDLPTTHEGSHYHAHLNPAAMTPGTYQFQTSVPDQAGNVNLTSAIAGRGGDSTETIVVDACHVGGHAVPCDPGSSVGSATTGRGTYTVVDNLWQWLIGPDGRPYDHGARVATRLRAGIVTKTGKGAICATTRGKHAKRSKHARCKRSGALDGATGLAAKVRLAYGTAATVQGEVTLAGGGAMPGAEVLVLRRFDAAGARYTLLKTLTADRSGRFTFNSPAGASRTVAFLYRGSHSYKHSQAAVLVQVPAASTINASKKQVRNGSSVMFAGRLLGGPYPKPGKLVALDAFYRARWRTFAVTRADGRGTWRFKYQFQATTGTVVYRFRARVQQEAAYPYLLGYSRAVPVRVTG